MAVGAGCIWLPVFSPALCLIVLVVFGRYEHHHTTT